MEIQSETCISADNTRKGKCKDYQFENKWKEDIDLSLTELCLKNRSWLWLIFVLAASPGILNGMHLLSYSFFTDNDAHYCKIPVLKEAGWTPEQIKNISLPPPSKVPHLYGCEYYNLNYTLIAYDSVEVVANYLRSVKRTKKLIPCHQYEYENEDSVISEWDLVCDRFYYRSNIQAAYALGKFAGASFFGIIADKYGRKSSFTLAALCYLVSAILAAFSSTLNVFLCIRFLLGFSGVGCYGTAYTLLSEITVGRDRAWVCCSFNISYPIGMIILSYLAYHVHYWKTLLIIISVPTIVLPFYYWFLPESPQWLLSQNRYDDAWKTIQDIDKTVCPRCEAPPPQHITHVTNKNEKIVKKLIRPFTEFISIFSTWTLAVRSLVCFFIWFSVSCTYIGLAMNGHNLMINQYIYVALNGFIEIFSYLLPVPMLTFFGRKTSCTILFTLTSILLISIMFIPSAGFVIFALYTSELFPTSVRNTSIGASLTMSHVGTFMSPYIVDALGDYLWYIPSTLFGLFSLGNIVLLVALPETRNRPSFNTIEEMKMVEKTR